MLDEMNQLDGDTGSRAAACEDRLVLWERMVKARWLRLDEEAERLAAAIGALQCKRPLRLPPRIHATD